MKSKAIITISLISALSAATLGAIFKPATAYAATPVNSTYYPEIFTEYVNDNLEGLTDFATDGRSYAFSDRNRIVVVENEERVKYEVKNVSMLDYSNGTYYYKVGSNSYSLPTLEVADYEFSTDYSRAIISGDDTKSGDYKIKDGVARFCPHDDDAYTPFESESECLKFKVYNNNAYGFFKSKEGVTTVKKLYAATATDVNPSYIDFRGTKQVALGTIRTSLAAYNKETPHFVTLNFGSYYTEIDINNINGEYFDTQETYKCGDEGAIPSDAVMLALGESGNAKVFTYDEKCYIALASSLKTDTYSDETGVAQAEFTDAYVNAPDWIYSSPHLCGATKSLQINAGDAVKVTGKVSTENLNLQFYKVEAGEGESKVTGYVLAGLLRPYSAEETEHPDDKNFGIIKDPDYTTDDYVKIAVLLLIVIALVLIGLAYITYVLTSKKNKKDKQAEEKSEEKEK